MNAGYFSPYWSRVATLAPRLRSDAAIIPRRLRGETWYVVQDPQTGRAHRFSPAAKLFLTLMDGRRTIADIFSIVSRRLGADAPGQQDVIRLLSQLHAADLLLGDLPPDIEEIGRRQRRQRSRNLLAQLLNPLAIRVPLFDPDRFLGATLPIVAPFFSVAGFLVWLLVVVAGAALAMFHWEELTRNIVDRTLAPSNLVMLFLIYPFVKLLHEFSHGWATRRWGGHVHEIGVMLLIFFPVPYVNASESGALPRKRQRIVVGAAGIMCELMLASLATMLWVAMEAGPVRAALFNVMLIGGVSTLLVNGNPLLRYDGYYVLSDLTEIPNLATRARNYVGWLARHYAFGLRDEPSPVTGAGEEPWLLGYALFSFAYRLTVTAAIALLLARQGFFVGVLLAILAIGGLLAWPLAKGCRFVLASARLRGRRLRAVTVSAAAAAGLALLLFAVPLPRATLAQGVVQPSESATVRAGEAGIVAALLVAPGAWVESGIPLVRLEEPTLAARIKALEAELLETDLRLQAAVLSDQVGAKILREQRDTTLGALASERARAEALMLRAGTSGVFVPLDPINLEGRFLARGDIVGYLRNVDSPVVRALVHENDVELIGETRGIEIRFGDRPGDILPARLLSERPAAVRKLPSPVLGPSGGGWWPVDVMAPGGDELVQPAFEFDIVRIGPGPQPPIGARAYVRFSHPSETLAARIGRWLRQLFLSQLDV